MIIKPPPIRECVPLCGADRSYGPNAPWWRHATLCPARESRRERRTPENVQPELYCDICGKVES